MKEAQQLREVRDENHRLKKLVADLSVRKEMFEAVIAQRVHARFVELVWEKPRYSYRRFHILLDRTASS